MRRPSGRNQMSERGASPGPMHGRALEEAMPCAYDGSRDARRPVFCRGVLLIEEVHAVSHFFAYLSRMKFIKRWGLMHNTYPENIQEHSLRVAMIAHALGVIRNRMFEGRANPERAAVLALFHDAGEVLIGDLPTPVKYFNPEIRTAYQTIETVANRKLLDMLPGELRDDYRALFLDKAEIGRAHV